MYIREYTNTPYITYAHISTYIYICISGSTLILPILHMHTHKYIHLYMYIREYTNIPYITYTHT